MMGENTGKATLGALNTLMVVKTVDFGVYLDGGELGEILLPLKQVPEKCKPGDMLEVFLYLDTENRQIATTYRPHALIGEVGWLKVIAVNEIGAFLDWGIPRDLFVPFAEQRHRMKEGSSYPVYVYVDAATNRITGSSKLEKFLSKNPIDLKTGQQVDLLIGDSTEFGFKAIVNNTFMGFIFRSDIFQPLTKGLRIQGYVKNVREDGKIDLCLQKSGYEKIPEIAEKIFETIRASGGFLAVTDKSGADRIKELFGVSKKTYKKAVGSLFKAGRVSIEADGITLKKPSK